MSNTKISLPNRIIHLNNGNIISIANSINKMCSEPKLIISTYRDKNSFKSHLPDKVFNMNLKDANRFIQGELLMYNL